MSWSPVLFRPLPPLTVTVALGKYMAPTKVSVPPAAICAVVLGVLGLPVGNAHVGVRAGGHAFEVHVSTGTEAERAVGDVDQGPAGAALHFRRDIESDIADARRAQDVDARIHGEVPPRRHLDAA